MPELALALGAWLYSMKAPFVSFAGRLNENEDQKYSQEDVSNAHNELENSCMCLVAYRLNFSTDEVANLTPQESATATCRQLQTVSKSLTLCDVIAQMGMGIQSQERVSEMWLYTLS